VIACNNDGVWNTQGASVALVVLPFFWETWWFLGLAALTVLSLVVLLVRHFTRRRLQRRLEDLQRRHAIERERARIAQDIHDDIGANLTRITMLSQCLPAESETPAARETANVLVNIYDTAREVTRSLDEIVWAANPRHDSLDSLVSYMGHFAQDFLAAANVRCRLDLPVKLPDWPLTAEIRHNVFLAFKEALNNTLKHADATEVRVALRLEPDAFVLTISDNGRGFETAETGATEADRSPTRNGLENLRRRLAGIGGRCEIASTAGVGTQVTFLVFPSGSAAPDRGQSAQP
jgi:signal transduction histidine kinase